MTEFAEFLLGPGALRYIDQCLGYGKTLSHELQERLSILSGRVTTLLPQNTPEVAAHEFHTGGKLPTADSSQWITSEDSVAVPIPTTLPLLVPRIQGFLGNAPGNACVFENSLAGANDPFTQTMRSRTLMHRDEVYHLLTGSDSDEQAILDTLDEAFSIPIFIGTFAALTEDELSQVHGVSEIGSDWLAICAARTQKIIVGAYDGEGFLIWHK